MNEETRGQSGTEPSRRARKPKWAFKTIEAGLPTCIEKAKAILAQDGRGWVPTKVMTARARSESTWSSMKEYGLVERNERGTAYRLTDLGVSLGRAVTLDNVIRALLSAESVRAVVKAHNGRFTSVEAIAEVFIDHHVPPRTALRMAQAIRMNMDFYNSLRGTPDMLLRALLEPGRGCAAAGFVEAEGTEEEGAEVAMSHQSETIIEMDEPREEARTGGQPGIEAQRPAETPHTVEIIKPAAGSLTVTVTVTELEIRGSMDEVRKVINPVFDRVLNRNPGHSTVIPPFKH